MSRALKLFCVIGPLLILIVLISFLWIDFTANRDMKKFEKLFLRNSAEEQTLIRENRASLFRVKADQNLFLTDNIIRYIQNNKSLQESFEKAIREGTVWKKIGEILPYSISGIGLLQITKDSESILTIVPQNALIYDTQITKLNDHVVLSLVKDYSGILEGYLGIRLAETPAELQEPLGFYFIYPISYFFPELILSSTDLLKTIEPFANDLSGEIEKNKITSLKALISYFSKLYKKENVKIDTTLGKASPKDSISLYRDKDAYYINFHLTQYIRLLLESNTHSPFDNGAPYGVSSFTLMPDQNFNGSTLLASDVFFNKPLETKYLEKKPFLIIDSPLLKEVFIGASTDIHGSDGIYSVTVGRGISPYLSDLTDNLETIVIITENNKPYIATNPEGMRLPFTVIETISTELMSKQDYGVINFNKLRYQFIRFYPFGNNILSVVILSPEDADPLTLLAKALPPEINQASKILSWQILGINFFILMLALLILLFLSRAFTRHVRQLALAMDVLATGKYAEITFPDLRLDSKDEVSILTEGFKKVVVALCDKEKVRAILDKVVSKEIAAEILKGDIHLGGENRIMTVLFADIRNFTHMSEKIEPESLILFLNKFMTKMSFIIEDHYGVIDKYVGDEIMALYGAPQLDPDNAKKAVETAILMMSELKKWNIKRALKGFPEIYIGIGINTGKMVVGNMGAENRLNYTVLGANVNLGARLCSKAEPMQILVSESTFNACGLKESLDFKEVESLSLKGLSIPVKAYSILGFKNQSE